jgi:hypothetical protein
LDFTWIHARHLLGVIGQPCRMQRTAARLVHFQAKRDGQGRKRRMREDAEHARTRNGLMQLTEIRFAQAREVVITPAGPKSMHPAPAPDADGPVDVIGQPFIAIPEFRRNEI